MWREVENLQPLITTTIAMLSIGPATEITIGRDLVRRTAVPEDVAVKLLHAETRLQQRARVERRLVVQSSKPAALMKVRGRVGRVKSVQIEEVKLLREDRKARRQSIVVVDDVVESRKRIKTLALDVALVLVERLETRHFGPHKSIFDTLKKEELVFLDRTPHCDARRGGADAVDLAVAEARSRQDAEKQVTKIVTTRARLDRRHGASELSKLRRIRIRMHLHRVDGLDRQLDRGCARHRIRNVQTRNQNAALRRSRAFDVQVSIRTTHDAR